MVVVVCLAATAALAGTFYAIRATSDGVSGSVVDVGRTSRPELTGSESSSSPWTPAALAGTLPGPS